MNTILPQRSRDAVSLHLVICLIALSIISPSLGQSNPCAAALKDGIYNHFKERTLLQKHSSMMDYLKSNDFEKDVRNNKWGGGLTIPINGIPIGVNANSSTDGFTK